MNICVRFAFLGSIFALLFCALVIEISIIAEINRENKKRGCKKNQGPGKSNDPTCLNFCPTVESAKQGSEALRFLLSGILRCLCFSAIPRESLQAGCESLSPSLPGQDQERAVPVPPAFGGVGPP